MPRVRKWLGKNKILEDQGNVGEFYFESGKISKQKPGNHNTSGLEHLMVGRNISG